jgi:hypothetical protein
MIAQAVGFHSSGSLGVVQLATANRDVFQYITSSQAINAGILEVREVSDAGSVNHLLAVNMSDAYVFLMDGDILTGAKQNRVLNTSVLLAPKSKTTIPVSCVEHGRWNYASPTFSGVDYTAPPSMRASKASHVRQNLRKEGDHMADQGEVWHDVSRHQTLLKVSSPTDSLHDVFAQRAPDLGAAAKQFEPVQGANGLALYHGKVLVSVDIFHRTDAFAEYFPKLVRGAMMELMGMPAKKGAVSEAEARFRVLDLLDATEEAEIEEFPGVAVGREFRSNVGDLQVCDLRVEGLSVHFGASRLERKKAQQQGVQL